MKWCVRVLGKVLRAGFCWRRRWGWRCIFIYRAKRFGFRAGFWCDFWCAFGRGQICFTSALRDLWLFNSSNMSKTIIAGMAFSAVMTLIF